MESLPGRNEAVPRYISMNCDEGEVAVMNLRVIQMISPILFSAAAILWVTDVISQPVFITLVILETAITMGLVIWQVRRQSQAADSPPET